MLRGLLLGIPVGLLAGWLLFEWGDADAPPPRAPSPTSTAPAPPPLPAPVGSGGGTGRPLSPASGSGGAERAPAPADVPALIAKLDAARAAKDWDAFYAALARLAQAGTGTADDTLVQLMGDPALELPDASMHRAFLHWLGASDAPGIAAAARARAEKEYAAGQGPLQPGWLALVARHGDAADLQWLDAMEKARGGPDAVLEALAHAADRPQVERTLLLRFEERGGRGWKGETLAEIARRNESLARRLITEGYERCAERERGAFMGIYGGMATGANLEETRAFLQGLGNPSARVHAAYALQAMERRGLSLEGLEALRDEPARRLDELSRAPAWPHSPVQQVRAVIEHNPVTWNDRTLAALETAIGKAPLSARRALEQLRDKVRAAVKGEEDWNR